MSNFTLPRAPKSGTYGEFPMEVVGIYYRPEGQAKLVTAHANSPDPLLASFSLVPEPDNPYDNHAISVRFRGSVIGYLSRDAASRWWPAITYLVVNGRNPLVHGRATFSGDIPQVRLSMARPKTSVKGVAGAVPYKDQGCSVPRAFTGSGTSSSPGTAKPGSSPRQTSESPSSSSDPWDFGCAMIALAVLFVIFLIAYALI